jgi:hypothetical protein
MTPTSRAHLIPPHPPGGAVPIRPLPSRPVDRITVVTFDEIEEALCNVATEMYVARAVGQDTAAYMVTIDDLFGWRQLITDCWHAHHARMCS